MMKTVFFSAFLALVSSVALNIPMANAASVDEAKKAYAEREYDNPGVLKAQKAADLYGQLVSATADAKAKAQYLVRQSEALYFVGDASPAKATKLEKHNQGYLLADQAVKALGVKDVKAVTAAEIATLKSTLTPAQLNLLADALYHRGVNLGKWGSANGVASSLGKWPELRATMELIGKLGKDDVHSYGSYRTLGRAYAQLPSLLGGSTAKAEKYLQTGTSKTLAAGQVYSVNGYNNVYYAEVLKEVGKVAQAKTLLQGFIAANPATLNPALEPEVRRAQAEAKELLKSL